MIEQSIGLFVYGAMTFLTPCSLALISAYLTFTVSNSNTPRAGLIIGLGFVSAMGLVFWFLGYAVSSLIPLSWISGRLFYGAAGALLILFGAGNLGLLSRVGLLRGISGAYNERVNAATGHALQASIERNLFLGSFILSVVISLALSPCSLALVLPAVMYTLFSAPTPFHGGFLLMAFGLGHALPVVFLSVVAASARKFLRERLVGIGSGFTKVSGAVFCVIGILLILYSLKYF